MDLDYSFKKIQSLDSTHPVFAVGVDVLQKYYQDLLKEKNLEGDIPSDWHYASVRDVTQYALYKLKELINSTDPNFAFEIAILVDYLKRAFEEITSFDPAHGL